MSAILYLAVTLIIDRGDEDILPSETLLGQTETKIHVEVEAPIACHDCSNEEEMVVPESDVN